ncbi:phage tail tip lysozyme [uncultured Veillonella sp.]|uniref:phage tail tip lysozyme n=1 Tax=uncultured Veillonella sp. TaxID=159268 RepID=UPI0025CBE932|nr:phage tail tip lysozyme [uncultured Veillonella sp.]
MMGTTIADLEVRIGADSNQFKQELQKVETQVGKAFNVNPINEFSTSVDSVTGRVGSLVSKFTAIAGIMAGGFGLTSMIEGSVKAGEAVYQLSQRYQITTKEASEMNRILKITGSDADTAAKTIMRLDKALSGNSNEGKKAQETLKLFGVSLTDANGKMLPINQQLAELAKGYKAAADAGYGQEYVMNTLGVRGLALISVLQNYNEAATIASKVKGIGLNPEEMHKASLQLKEMEMQFGQLKLASGAAITPLVMELLPQLLPYLQESAVWINKNKNEIASTAKTLVQIVALYESIKIAKKAAAAVNAVVSTVKNSQSPMGLDTAELTRAQEAQINKALRDNERVYAQMRREAIKTANQQKLSAEETSAFLAQEFSKISIKATQSAEQIRAAMTLGFQSVRAEAAESSIAVNRSILSTGVAAEKSANLHVAANVRKVESDMAVVASQGKVGVAATVAGTKAVEASATATAAATANIEKNAVLAASYEGVGIRATTAGAVAVSAAGRAMGAVTTLTRAVWALAGGWLGVAAAVGFALYSMGQANKAEAEFQHANEVTLMDKGKIRHLAKNRDGKVVFANDSAGYVEVPERLRKKYESHVAAQKKASADAALGEIQAEQAKLMESINAQIQNLGSISDSAGNTSVVEHSEHKDTSSAAETVRFMINQGIDPRIAFGMAGGNMQESSGNKKDLDPMAENPNSGAFGIQQWFLDRKDALFKFAEDNHSDPYDLHTQQAFQVYEMLYGNERDNYKTVLAELGNSQDVGLAARLVDEHITRSEGTEGIRAQKAANAQSLYNDMKGEGGLTGADILRRQKSIDDAKKDLKNLEGELKQSITGEIGTSYESEIQKIEEDVRKKSEAIKKIKDVSDTIDTSNAEKLLNQFKTVEVDKVNKKLQEQRDKLKLDTAKINAEILGNYKDLAEKQFIVSKSELDREREERLKSVAKQKDDAEAKAQVEEWYTAKYKALVTERETAERESYDKAVKLAISRHDTNRLQQLTSSKDAKQYRDWEGDTAKLQTFYKLWEQGNMSMSAATAEAAESFASGLSSIFSNLATDITSVKDLTQNMGKLILSTVVNIIAKIAAARLAAALLGQSLGGGTPSIASGGNVQKLTMQGFVNSAIARMPNMPTYKFASGGVITAPVMSLMGEGKDNEAVLPLNQNTFASLGRNIANTIGGGPVMVNVNNYTNSKVTVTEETSTGDIKTQIVNIVIEEIASNRNGSQDILKQLIGGRR